MLAAEVLVLESSTHSYTFTKCCVGDLHKPDCFHIATADGEDNASLYLGPLMFSGVNVTWRLTLEINEATPECRFALLTVSFFLCFAGKSPDGNVFIHSGLTLLIMPFEIME